MKRIALSRTPIYMPFSSLRRNLGQQSADRHVRRGGQPHALCRHPEGRALPAYLDYKALQVTLHAAGLNFVDIYLRRGELQEPGEEPRRGSANQEFGEGGAEAEQESGRCRLQDRQHDDHSSRGCSGADVRGRELGPGDAALAARWIDREGSSPVSSGGLVDPNDANRWAQRRS